MFTKDTATITATADADGVTISPEMAAWIADQEHADREREMRRYGFGQRQSHCG